MLPKINKILFFISIFLCLSLSPAYSFSPVDYHNLGWNNVEKGAYFQAGTYSLCPNYSSRGEYFWKTASTPQFLGYNPIYFRCRERWTAPFDKPTSSPSSQTKSIHLYPYYGLNSQTQIKKTHIISLLFVPKDITLPIKTEWYQNMNIINTKIKGFFEREFQNNIEISHEFVPQPISGSKNIAEYTSDQIALEAKQKIADRLKSDSYNTVLVYLVRDLPNNKVLSADMGSQPTLGISVQGEFWLDNVAVNPEINNYGVLGSAHEFGHLLGIPHPWDLPANVNHDANFGNLPGDLMSYSNDGINFNNLYLRDDVKSAMGL